MILRKRTQRTFVDFYSKIIDPLEADGDVPEGVRRFIGIVEDEEPVDERHSAETSQSTQTVDTELYFPLPANEEQKK